MTLRELTSRLGIPIPPDQGEKVIKGIKVNSKDVTEGDLFVALKGTHRDGHLFIDEAISRGAIAIICDEDFWGEWPGLIKVRDTRAMLPWLSRYFYRDPIEDIILTGVTGTNGKTTTCFLLSAILKADNKRPGIIGTLGYGFDDVWQSSNLTTPDPVELMKIFSIMRGNGLTHIVMEVSSHSLSQQRVEACRYLVAIFTNLSRDHLDYHRDMDDYFNQKSILFEKLLSPKKTVEACSVINSDDSWGKKLLDKIKGQKITYGMGHKNDVYPLSYELNTKGIRAKIRAPSITLDIRSHLLGVHNLYNIMAAIGGACGLGVQPRAMEAGIEEVRVVPGRLEYIPNPLGIDVFVDYAHTPDALEKVLMNLRALSPRRLVVVFGCGGDRDKGKRPQMGKIAVGLADHAVITSDNPRTEDPAVIIDDILRGIEGVEDTRFKNYEVELDRKKAIEKALRVSSPGDIVLIAGKGHEDYQIIGDIKHHFSDKEIVIEMAKVISGENN